MDLPAPLSCFSLVHRRLRRGRRNLGTRLWAASVEDSLVRHPA